MRAILVMTMFLAAVLSAGCGPILSLYPLWDEAHLTTLPQLEGIWISGDGKDELEFAAMEKAGYRLKYRSNDEVSRYEVRIVRLGDRLFLDLGVDEKALEKRLEGEAFLPLIPAHFFVRIRLEGDSLQVALLQDEALTKKVESGEVRIPLVKWEGSVVLTADTAALQQLLSRLSEDEKLWSDSETFTRRPAKKE